MYYGSEMMKQAGLQIEGYSRTESSLLLYLLLSFINAAGCIIAVFFIDRLGRRYIILRSMPFAAASWIVTAIGMSMTGLNHDEDL